MGSTRERGPRLPSPPLCLGLRRQREPWAVRWAERLSGVAARVPPPLPCPSPAANCLQRTDLGTEKKEDGADQRREGGLSQVRRGVFSYRPPRLAGWPGRARGRGGGVAEKGARVGMNDRPPAGRSGCALAAAPCPTCLARTGPRSAGSSLGCSTRLRAELGGAQEEGGRMRLRVARATESPLLFLF